MDIAEGFNLTEVKKYSRFLWILLLVLVVVYKGAELWIEYRFEALINKNPDRAYNLVYEDMDLHTFFKGVTLKKMKISKKTFKNFCCKYILYKWIWQLFQSF